MLHYQHTDILRKSQETGNSKNYVFLDLNRPFFVGGLWNLFEDDHFIFRSQADQLSDITSVQFLHQVGAMA